MNTVISEPKLVQDLNTEYYKLINFFSNTKRQSSFIKYYNRDMTISPKKDITLESFDSYTKSQSQWNVFEWTPTQIISAIQNSPENNPDLAGNMITSATTILTYTIQNPRIGDLVTFYKPVESDEVLRVTNIRLQLNSNYSSESIKWYELDLETAPIRYQNLNQLIKQKHFVYDLSIEKNVEYEFYKDYVSKINKLETLLTEFNQFYIAERDLYSVNGQIIIELNELLYFLKTNFDNKFYRLFENVKSPFGYWDRYKFKFNSVDDMKFDETKIFNLKDYFTLKETEYDLSRQVNNELMNTILQKVIDLLIYIREIGEYIDHTSN